MYLRPNDRPARQVLPPKLLAPQQDSEDPSLAPIEDSPPKQPGLPTPTDLSCFAALIGLIASDAPPPRPFQLSVTATDDPDAYCDFDDPTLEEKVTSEGVMRSWESAKRATQRRRSSLGLR